MMVVVVVVTMTITTKMTTMMMMAMMTMMMAVADRNYKLLRTTCSDNSGFFFISWKIFENFKLDWI